MAKQKSKTRQIYERELTLLKNRIRRYQKQGFFYYGDLLTPKKRATKKAIEELRSLKGVKLQSAVYNLAGYNRREYLEEEKEKEKYSINVYNEIKSKLEELPFVFYSGKKRRKNDYSYYKNLALRLLEQNYNKYKREYIDYLSKPDNLEKINNVIEAILYDSDEEGRIAHFNELFNILNFSKPLSFEQMEEQEEFYNANESWDI